MTLLVSFFLSAAIIAAGYVVFAASWYDIRAITRRAHLAAILKKRQPRQPSIAIIIDAETSASTLEQCLRTVTRGGRHHFSLIITTSQPNASVKQVVQAYRQRHPKLSLRYYVPRRVVSSSLRLRQAYHRLSAHDYILVLEASDLLTSPVIKQAVAQFRDDAQLGELRLAQHSQLSPTFLSLVGRYNEMSRQLLQKAAPRLARHTLTHIQTGTLYQHHYFTTKARRHRYRRRYAAWLIITSPHLLPTQVSRFFVMWWLLSIIAACYLMTVALTAATLKSAAPLLLTWVSICLWTLIAIWSETNARPTERLALSYGLLLAPLLLFMQTIWLSLALPIITLSKLARQRYHYWHRGAQSILRHVMTIAAWYEQLYPRELGYQDKRQTDN